MGSIQAYYQNAQLSMAAYANLSVGMSPPDYIEELVENAGFSLSQATQFVATFSIVSVSPPSLNGFSAVLFQKNDGSNDRFLAIRGTNDPFDAFTDLVDIGLLGSTDIQAQYASLEAFYTQLQDELRLTPAHTLTVTGHSSGGFLAQTFTADHAVVASTYTYNAPGIGGSVLQVLELLGVTPATLNFPNITNVVGQSPSLISGFGTYLGTVQRAFIESSLVDPIHNHGIATLTDALALYDLMARIDPTVAVQTVTTILNAVAATAGSSLENGLDAFRKLFQGSTVMATPVGDREVYYTNLLALRNALPPGPNHIDSLVGIQSNTVLSQANADTLDGLAYRYALKELNPFVLLGVDYQTLHNADGALDLYNGQTGQGTWTALALQDRAELLASKNQVNVNDGELFSGLSTDTHFADIQTGFEFGITLAMTNDVIFGDDRVGDVINGRGGDDHLYGGDGADTIEGNGGRDYIEGNAGNDPLLSGGDGNDIILGQQGNDRLDGGADNDRLNGGLGDDRLDGGAGVDQYTYFTGQGQDRIVDSDRFGTVAFDGQALTGGLRRAGDPTDIYTSSDGHFTYVRSGNDLIVNNVLTIENFDFANGTLGIYLADGAGTPTGPPPTPSYDRTISGSPADEFVNDGLTNVSNDQLYGGAGRDVVQAGGGQDALYGGDGDDLLIDFLYGEGEDDYLHGGGGHDYVLGGVGNEIAMGGEGNDFLFGSSYGSQPDVNGQDYLDGGSGNDYLWGGAAADTLVGGADQDLLRGDNLPGDIPTASFTESGYVLNPPPNPSAVMMSAGGGSDFLDGGAGDDFLQGDAGDDILIGGLGADRLYGDNQDEFVINEGDDFLDGGDGDDQLFAAGGNDSLSGAAGVDQLYGDQGDDILDGGDGADTMVGGDGADVLFGGTGNDLLFGEGLNNPLEASNAGAADFLDGGEGDDELQGGVGDDSLFGGSGADLLFGQEGHDSLLGDEGNDELQGGIGQDVLQGDAGNDSLFGQEDNDMLSGDDGNDFLNGGLGNDELDGGAGADQLVGDAGADVLFGQAGNDVLFGDGQVVTTDVGADILDGGDGHDLLQGGGGDDKLEGGAGDDELYGELHADSNAAAGNDDLQGGTGDDRLHGGGGRDTYRFNVGDGRDLIEDMQEQGNRLVFGTGITSDDLSLGVGGLDSLIVRVGSTGDAVEITRFGTNTLIGSHPIDSFEFADGTVLTYGQLAARGFDLIGTVGNDTIFGTQHTDRIAGGAGNDTLQGGLGNDALDGGADDDVLLGGDDADVLDGGAGQDQLYGQDGHDQLAGSAGDDFLSGDAGNDVLSGGTGDDALLGGEGDDTYHFNVADGVDSIGDVATSTEVNRVIFGPGIVSDAMKLTVVNGQLRLPIGLSGDALVLNSELSDVVGVHAIGRFEFNNGNVLPFSELISRGIEIAGTEADDQLFGTNLGDQILGGMGNDVVNGGAGSDRYVFNVGDGQDLIQDVALLGEENEVMFGPGITADQLQLSLAPDLFDASVSDLLIRLDSGDAIQLDTFDRNDVLSQETVGAFHFSDGASLSYDQLLSLGFALDGTTADDQLHGTNVADRISGFGGGDALDAGSGDDVLDGAEGDDRLQGGKGSDIYLFGIGSGSDTISETEGELDIIRFAPDVLSGNVTVSRSERDLLFAVAGGPDQVTISNYFLSRAFQVEQVEFADGTVWDQAFILSLTQNSIIGSSAPDTLAGTLGNDVLVGFGGNDILTGLAGDDVLDGGPGADTLRGGEGNDVFVIDDVGDVVIESVNEGTDTVHSSVAATLGDQIENLICTGSAAVVGTGNALDNVLVGNSGANVLTGGAGNDIYVIGPGDTVVEKVDEGVDTVQTDQSYTLDGNIENLTLTGTSSVNGTGNTFDNMLIGNSGVNTLSGGAGNDTYFVSSGDTVIEAAGEGIDTIQSARTVRLGANVENITLLGDEAVDGIGNELDNVLVGNQGANALEGCEGADRLDGGGGDDTLVGGGGQDVYLFGQGAGHDVIQDVVFGERDTIQISSDITPGDVRVAFNDESELFLEVIGTGDRLTIRNYSPHNSDDQGTKEVRFADGTVWDGATLVGKVQSTPGPNPGEFFTGTLANDTLVGTGGDDTFEGLAGNDQVDGRDGNDFVKGYVGNDLILGGDGNDTLYGEYVWIGNPIDTNDVLRGEAGNDVLYGDIGNDVLDGGSGNDWIEGGDGVDTYMFGRGYGTDQVITYGGNDRILLTADLTPADVIVSGGSGELTLRIAGTSDQLFAPLPPDDPSHRIGHVEFADGTVWTQAMLLEMTRMIRGTNGADSLFGTGRQETFAGGPGDDTYVGVEAGDIVVEAPDEGTDTIVALSSYTLPDHIENLRLQSAAILGSGNGADNVITGTNGDNVLDGRERDDTLVGGSIRIDEVGNAHGDGSDVLIGGAGDDVLIPSSGYQEDGPNYLGQNVFGDDVLIGGVGNDTYVLYNRAMDGAGAALIARAVVVESADEGSDTVIVASDYTLGENVESLALVGSDSLRGTGNESGNVLIGNGGDNLLEGLGGDDTLIGGFGQSQLDDSVDDHAVDTLVGGSGDDTYVVGNSAVLDNIVELSDAGTDTVISQVSYALGSNVENLVLKGATAIAGTGNSLANVLVGGGTENILAGGMGDDQLYGDRGSDMLRGEAGHDTYGFNLGDGVDTIEDAAITGEGNCIQFGAGISQSDLIFTQDQAARTLTIQVGSSGSDKLILTSFDPTGTGGSLVVETLAFADGSTAGVAAILGFGGPMETNGDDTIATGPSDDVINALGGNDIVGTGAGNDTITGGMGNDQLAGGTGSDTYIFNSGDGVDTIADTSLPGEGNILQFGEDIAPDDLSLGLGSLFIRVGTSGDAIHLTDFDPANVLGPRTIETFRFADGTVLSYEQLVERGFDLTGTTGNDTIMGTNVVDRISSLAGNDTVVSAAGDDYLDGGIGNDLLDGGVGADTMTGGIGDDTYVVDDAGDVVSESAGEGNDTVESSISHTLDANLENLIFTGTGAINGAGNALNNVLIGNSADNVLDGQAGADTMVGGAGNDRCVVDHNGDVVIEQLGEGMDSVQSSVTYMLAENVEHLTLTGMGAINGVGNVLDNMLMGNDAANLLDGGAGNDMLVGGAADDTLLGGAGNDSLDGGSGADAMIGGAGDDTYLVDSSSDSITEVPIEGMDTVESAVTYSLGSNLERLTLTGAAALNGTGNALDNTLIGNNANNTLNGAAGDDRLDGGLGNDTMIGGTGNDTYVVNQDRDVVRESFNQGMDTIESSVTYVLGSNVENLTLTGFASISGTGNSLNNALRGNGVANVLDAGSGNDLLDGGDGNDWLSGGSGHDTMLGGLGNDTLTAGSGNDALDGAEGTDSLDAGSGNDILSGGPGNDRLMGGSGNDLYRFDRTDGQDVILDASGTADRLLFDADINPLDLVISRQVDDLRLAVHGTSDQVTIQDWYVSDFNHVETLQAGNGQELANTKVDQLLQAMAAFTQQSGLTWDEAIDQRPQDVQSILAASWQ